MRKLLIFICCAYVSLAAQQSIRQVDWSNFSYPLPDQSGVPVEIHWMSPADATDNASLKNGKYDTCGDDTGSCPLVAFDSVSYGTLTGIKSRVALVVLTYHTGGTATWQFVYVFAVEVGKPRLLGWLRTGSRAAQGLREVSTTGGDIYLVVNDPDKRQGDCCSSGSITNRYRWAGDSFSAIGDPVYKTDPPSFDCKKAAMPVERLICQDVDLSFLDKQMSLSYQRVLKSASEDRRRIIRRQQADWFAEYRRTCNVVPLSEDQRRNCIDHHLNDRLMTLWK